MAGAEQQSPAWTQQLLREHPALLISGLYVSASTIGMFFAWNFLRRFGINVFNYAEIGDFLLASLKEPFTWAVTILAALLVALDNASSRRAASKYHSRWIAWYGSARYRRLNYICAVVMVVLFLNVFAAAKSRDVFEGNAEIVSVTLTDESPAKQMTLLGTTGRFVFLYEHKKNRVDIHPNENVLTITKTAVAPNRNLEQ